MKYIQFLMFFVLSSCGYPDIDTVPKFKDLDLTNEEIIDLCQLSSTDKSDIDTCIKDNQKK